MLTALIKMTEVLDCQIEANSCYIILKNCAMIFDSQFELKKGTLRLPGF